MTKRLFIFMALYAEAKPLIKCLQLKRANVSCGFDVYAAQEEGIYLVLTGSGSVAAATAVGSCMTYYEVGVEDILINVGTCAARCEIGKIFLCNRLTEQTSGATFYPDIWYRHDFKEAELITVPKVLEQGVYSERDLRKARAGDFAGTFPKEPEEVRLYDMEAAAIYQAASYYLGPHQMCFLKIISDAGTGKNVTAEMLTALVEQNSDHILEQIDWLRQSAVMWASGMEKGGSMRDSGMAEVGDTERPLAFDAQWQEDCERLCTELHCSQTMRAAVEQCVRYWTLADVDYRQALGQMRADGLLPCRDKREGKQRFEELKKRLL